MTIGSVSILDPATPDGRLEVGGLRELLSDRLDRTPVLCRRLASLPLDLSRPYWVELATNQIDLEYHVERTHLPHPGGWHELSELVAWELARPLERDRPLWQLLLVEGLESVGGVPTGAVAIIARVHHAAIDGVSGAEILGALADVGEDRTIGESGSSEGRKRGATEGEAEEAGVLELLAHAGRDLAATPMAVSRTLGRSLLGLAGGVRHRAERMLAHKAPGEDRSGVASSPPLPFAAPRTSLNRAVTGKRSWAPAFFELERVKAIKNREGATVNDIVLSVCAGALRSWLESEGDLPEEPLVAMVPVSVRGASEQQSAGNLVSAMLVSLATNEPDPTARLRKIRDASRSSKVAHQAIGARTLVESAQLAPFALSGLGVRLYSRLRLAERHRPMFNLVITNVPGPPRPLSIAGAQMLAYAPTAPLFDGLGLILPVFSYAGIVSIGVTADRSIMPATSAFAARLEDALVELE
jgi:WS/DGAT/MGAT family acyltransferase